jgi:hypothetical protein
MAGRRRWQDNLSVDRFTPDELLTRDLHQQRLQQQISQAPLEQQLKEFQLTRSQSQEAKARYDMNKEIETDRQKSAFYNGLQELESSLAARGAPIGTKAHAEAFAAYAHEFPLARSSSDIDQTLKLHAAVHDDQAALTTRMATAEAAARAAGQIPEGMDVTATGEINLRTKPNNPEAQLLGYGYSPAQFLNPYKVERGTVDASGKFKGANDGNVMRIAAGSDKTGAPLVRTMSVPEFEGFKQALLPKSNATAAADIAPPATVAPAEDPTGVQVGPAPVPSAAPNVGDVQQGYRFKGGSPSSPDSWEPVQ